MRTDPRVTVNPINIDEAKTRLSQPIDEAASGHDVVAGRNGKPLARITRLTPPPRVVKFGVLKGKVPVADDFDAPLPEAVVAAFEGR